MPATTELLIEQIQAKQAAIAAAEVGGLDTSTLRADLQQLQRRLQLASEALNEGRQVLKD